MIRSLQPRNLVAVGGALLVVNSIYLGTSASATAFYFANVVLHIALGIATGLAAIRWLRRRPDALTPAGLAAATFLGIAAVLGLVLMVTGATRPFYWLLYAHIVAASAGTVLTLTLVAAAAVRNVGRLSRPAHVGSILLVLGIVGWTTAVVARQQAADREAYRIVNPAMAPARMEGEGAGPHGPFFPSSAETNVGGIIPANFFMTSAECGRCHKDIYEQWSSSMHRFSSFNNQWYRKSVEYMQDVVGTQPSKWCAGCHDHAVFFNGRFDRPIKEQIDTPEAQAGLGCTSCHAITRVKSTMGQGDFTVEYPPLHDLATSDNRFLRATHDYLLRLDPGPHRETFSKPFHREQTAEFCSSCHKVHLDVPVNDYRWFRGFNEYDNWQASGVSGQGARSFYYPPAPQKCADCHMPRVKSDDPAAKDGMVKSHRFPGANTAVPFVNGDTEQLRITQEFLRDGQVSVDIFGLVRGAEEDAGTARQIAAAEPAIASTFAVGEESMHMGAQQAVLAPAREVLAPLDRVDAAVRRGESVRIEVVVRTRKVGHFFPGGTVDAFDVWVELEAVDETGRVIYHSGSVADDGRGPVEPGAHFYRSLLLDEHGNEINKRNAWMARSVAYVRLIPPGAADTIHYRLLVPPDAGQRITLRAKVNYRKFAWWNTQWSFAGVPDPQQGPASVSAAHDDRRWVFTGDTSRVSGGMKRIPDIPTTVMAEATTTLRVVPEGSPVKDEPLLDSAVRERWNDYGIGLLLQGDLKAAEAAFLRVTRMEPGYADGWVNVARARLQEGDMAGAEEMLRRALEIDAGLAKTQFFLGTVLKNQGRYEEALGHLEIARSKYPRDRVVLNQLGRVRFLQRQFAEAVDAFKQVLAIDPEDLQAYYNLMLCYRGLGQAEMAAEAEVRYRRFKADEASQSITGPFRQLRPHDNNERQAIHEHRSAPLRQSQRTDPTPAAPGSR